MEIGAIVLFALWAIFVGAYIAVRTRYPNEGTGRRKWKKNKKYDADGFDKNGWSALGFHRNGTRYDDNGFDREGNPKPPGERTDLRAFDPIPERPKDEEEKPEQA